MDNAGVADAGMGGNASGPVGSEVDQLKQDLARLKEDIASLASVMKQEATTRARDAKDDAQLRMQYGVESVEQYIEEKPLTTVLVAFGVGLMLGTIFGR